MFFKNMKSKYFEVQNETPILNTANFQKVFDGNNNKLEADEKGHIRALEFIALKNMVFKIIKKTPYPYIYEVKNEIYENSHLYLDSRFTKPVTSNKTKPLLFNLKKDKLIKNLTSLIGTKYLWGGNWSRGVEKLIKFYPPKKTLNQDEFNKWQLKGVDCSGFLFEITKGFTPRNTKELLNYKNSVNIEGFSYLEISKILSPLDLIVFQGHVIIVLNNEFTIESIENLGVVQTPIIERLKKLFAVKKPANIYKNASDFVIRRWFNY